MLFQQVAMEVMAFIWVDLKGKGCVNLGLMQPGDPSTLLS